MLGLEMGPSAWREERRCRWTTRHAVSRPKQTVFIQSRLEARVCDHLAIQICPTGFGKVLFIGIFFPSNWLSFVDTSHGCWIYFEGCFLWFCFLLLHFMIINAKWILLKILPIAKMFSKQGVSMGTAVTERVKRLLMWINESTEWWKSRSSRSALMLFWHQTNPPHYCL